MLTYYVCSKGVCRCHHCAADNHRINDASMGRCSRRERRPHGPTSRNAAKDGIYSGIHFLLHKILIFFSEHLTFELRNLETGTGTSRSTSYIASTSTMGHLGAIPPALRQQLLETYQSVRSLERTLSFFFLQLTGSCPL